VQLLVEICLLQRLMHDSLAHLGFGMTGGELDRLPHLVLLCAEQREICLLHQVVGRFDREGARGIADRSRYTADILVRQVHRLVHGIDDLLRDAFGILLAHGLRQDICKFIPAETRDARLLTQHAFQAPGRFHQYGVARRVAEHVIDRFEPIQVNQADDRKQFICLRIICGVNIDEECRRLGRPVSMSVNAMDSFVLASSDERRFSALSRLSSTTDWARRIL
jgi:hypothetical protein